MGVSVQELERFLVCPAPRPVSAAVGREALKGSPAPLLIIGVIFFAVGVAFAGVFVPRRMADDWRLNRTGATAEGGLVEQVTETRMKENNRHVYRYDFVYSTDGGGVPRAGVCYSTGALHQGGDRVVVEYLPSDPSVARIRGCRLSPFGGGAIFIAVFPLVGVAMIAAALRARARILDLLRNGRFATGRIESVEATYTRINNQTVHKVSIVFRDETGDRTAHVRIRGSAVDRARTKAESKATIGVLVDPADPGRILWLDALTGA